MTPGAPTLNPQTGNRNVKPTIEINQTNFEAPWCGPCKMLAPVLDEIATEHAFRVKIAKVNVDDNAELANRFSIQSIPTLLYLAKGQVRNQTVGVVSKKKILENLNALSLTDAFHHTRDGVES
jgi:thioredoxin 1